MQRFFQNPNLKNLKFSNKELGILFNAKKELQNFHNKLNLNEIETFIL